MVALSGPSAAQFAPDEGVSGVDSEADTAETPADAGSQKEKDRPSAAPATKDVDDSGGAPDEDFVLPSPARSSSVPTDSTPAKEKSTASTTAGSTSTKRKSGAADDVAPSPPPGETMTAKESVAAPSAPLEAQGDEWSPLAGSMVVAGMGLGLGLLFPTVAVAVGAAGLTLSFFAQGLLGPGALVVTGFSFLSLGIGLLTTGPFGVCGATIGSCFYALPEDRSLTPTVIGLAAGIASGVLSGTAVVGLTIANSSIYASPLTTPVATLVPLACFAASGALTVAVVGLSQALLDEGPRVDTAAVSARSTVPRAVTAATGLRY